MSYSPSGCWSLLCQCLHWRRSLWISLLFVLLGNAVNVAWDLGTRSAPGSECVAACTALTYEDLHQQWTQHCEEQARVAAWEVHNIILQNAQMCVAPFAADLGVDPSGRPPRLTTHPLMAAVAVLRLSRRADPIVHGMFTNRNDTEKIQHHTFHNEFRVAPEENPTMLTEVPLNPKTNRKRMTQVMFVMFSAPATYVATQAVLSLYVSGRTTGLVMDLRKLRPASRHHRWDLAGCVLTMYLMRISSVTTTERGRLVVVAKRKMCFIAFDYDTELKSTAESSFQQEADPHALRRKQHHCRRRRFLLRECFSSQQQSQRSPQHFLSQHHEV